MQTDDGADTPAEAELESLRRVIADLSKRAWPSETEAVLHAAQRLSSLSMSLEEDVRLLSRAQRRLELTSGEFYGAFHNMPTGCLVLCQQGYIRMANKLACELVAAHSHARRGRDAEVGVATIIGARFVERIATEDRLAFLRAAADVWRSSNELCIEIEVCLQDGLPIRLGFARKPDDNEASKNCIVTISDASTHKARATDLKLLCDVDNVLRSYDDHLEGVRKALQVLPASMSVFGFVDFVQSDSPALLRVCPAPVDDTREIAQWCSSAFPQGARDTPQQRVLSRLSPARLPESDLATTDGAKHGPMIVIPLVAGERTLGTLTLVRRRGQRPYNLDDLSTATEIARRIALATHHGRTRSIMAKRLQQQQCVLGTVSHDLKNVLACMQLRIDALADDRRDIVRERGSLQRLTARMNRMVGDLLDATSIEKGHLSLCPKSHSCMTLVDDAVEAATALAATRNITVVAAGDDLLQAFCDRHRCEQVFANLIGNAIKYAPEGSTVQVRVERLTQDRVVFHIEDEGPGISPADSARIFDPFWQAPDTGIKGHGLGLAISRGIVEASGGRIWMEPRNGGGSIFSFTMPVDRVLGDAVEENNLILVVDDDPDLRSVVCEILQRAGFRTISAGDGEEALRMAHGACNPSLVLLDLNMPLMDGWEYLRRRTYDCVLSAQKVIVFSSVKDASKKLEGNRVSFLPKPLNGADLVAMVNSEMSQCWQEHATAG